MQSRAILLHAKGDVDVVRHTMWYDPHVQGLAGLSWQVLWIRALAIVQSSAVAIPSVQLWYTTTGRFSSCFRQGRNVALRDY